MLLQILYRKGRRRRRMGMECLDNPEGQKAQGSKESGELFAWQFGELRFQRRTVSSREEERNCSSVGDNSRHMTCFLWPLKYRI